MTDKRRTAILISGRGSNMASLIEAAQKPAYPAEIALVLSNNRDAAGLSTAQSHGINTAVVNHREFDGREPFEAVLHETLRSHAIKLICLAGFMRVLTASFVERWQGQMINIHPSLLPSYKGLHTHERALADGVKTHGCTVHYVVPEMDAGPIIVQASVPVFDGDNAATLAARVLEQEHKIYPQALALVAAGKLRLDCGRVVTMNGGDSSALTAPDPSRQL